MRAYLAINYHPDHANRPLIEAITDALAQHGYETVCIARDVEQWGHIRLTPAARHVLFHADFADFATLFNELVTPFANHNPHPELVEGRNSQIL
jgi:hypothetical protein